MRVPIAAVGLAALVVAGGASAAAPNGIWSGRIVDREEIANGWPVSFWSPTTLVVSSASVTATSEGKTMAAHDSPTARSTCSMRFRFVAAQSGWRIYKQTGGRPKLTAGSVSGGYPEGSLCSASGPSGSALRVRRAGAKLRVEFTNFYRAGEDDFSGAMSGYLKR